MTPYYNGGGIVIYHADCREALASMPPAAVVMTDPPYDPHTHANAKRRTKKSGLIPSEIAFDPLVIAEAVPFLLSKARRWTIAFCALEMFGAYRDAAGEAYIRSGFWRRLDGTPQYSGDRPASPGEGIAIMHAPGRKVWNRGGHHAYWESLIERKDRVHPTQKPELLMCQLLEDFTEPGEMVYDPYMGVGSTLVAARRLGRMAIGCETEERWCEHAARKLSQQALPLYVPNDPENQRTLLPDGELI